MVRSFCHWIVLESSSIHQQKAFIRYCFTIFLNKIARHKFGWTKTLCLSKTLEVELLDRSAPLLPLFFILENVLINIQSMSTKKQNSSLCKLYSIYEEIPEEFLDETDVNSYFHHNILNILQSHHRIVRVSKESNKKSFAFKVFNFCDSNLQQRVFLKEEVSISTKENESLLDSSGEFLKAFDQANKVSQIPLPKPKLEIYRSKRRTVQSLLQG